MKFRDLDKVSMIIKEATGLEITYAYDDLVFPEHAAFLIQFDDNDDDKFFCYFHKDCVAEEQKRIANSLLETCEKNDCSLISEGAFDLVQNGEEVEVHFLR